MVHYEVYYKDILIGFLDVDETGRHRYTVNGPGLAAVPKQAPMIPLLEKDTDGYVEPIPFFYTRINNMKRWNLTEINYQTDWYLLKKI